MTTTAPVMKILAAILIFVSSSCLVRAQSNGNETTDDGWSGCYGSGGGPSDRIKVGDPMFLCLHVASGRDWSAGAKFIRLSFSPKADEYSRLHIPNCK